MTIDRHENWEFSAGKPLIDGDLYYGTDKIRDYQFILDQIGKIGAKTAGSVPCVLHGCTVTKGTGDTFNITAGSGLVYYSVTIPNSYASLPPSTTTADIVKLVEVTAQTNLAIASATLDGATVNYIKVRYTETNGNSRAREFAEGTYYYERVPSFTITVSSVAPTAYDLVIGTMIGTTGSFTIINYSKPRWGWISARETWTADSLDSPSSVITVTGDVSHKYHVGQKICLTQATVKYFIITKIAVATDTTITMYGGTDYNIAVGIAITNNYYSNVRSPHGFPLDPTKWQNVLTYTGTGNMSGASSYVWYNVGSVSVEIPIGKWDIHFSGFFEWQITITTDKFRASLSTSNNSVSDAEFTSEQSINQGNPTCAHSTMDKTITLASKTTYYVIEAVGNTGGFVGMIKLIGDVIPTKVIATCAYL